jgi:hypothetical protein
MAAWSLRDGWDTGCARAFRLVADSKSFGKSSGGKLARDGRGMSRMRVDERIRLLGNMSTFWWENLHPRFSYLIGLGEEKDQNTALKYRGPRRAQVRRNTAALNMRDQSLDAVDSQHSLHKFYIPRKYCSLFIEKSTLALQRKHDKTWYKREAGLRMAT